MNNTTYVQDFNAIVAVLNQYNEGGKQAKSELMKPAFSDRATIFGLDSDGNLSGGPIRDCLTPSTPHSVLHPKQKRLSCA